MSRGRYVKGKEIDHVNRVVRGLNDRILKLETASSAVLPVIWRVLEHTEYETERQQWQQAVDILLIVLGPGPAEETT